MANIIDILLKAKDQTKGAFDSAKKGMEGLSDAADKAEDSSMSFADSWSLAITGISQGIMVAQQVTAALKEVYATAREGAELEYLETRFNNLTTSIGTTADVLLKDLREATHNTMSDAELMASATDMMALGLAKSHDEVVRLAAVAGGLGMNMNQLVLTLTNQTTMRFDALGVSVDGFDAKVKQLEETGLSASEAFQEAFLQQAEEQIMKVGNTADSSIGDFMRLESAFSNWANAVKIAIASDLTPAIQELAETLQTATDFQGTLDDAVKMGAITQEEYTHIQGQVHKGYMDIDEAIAFVIRAMEDYVPKASNVASETDNLIMSIYDGADSWDEFVAGMDAAGLGLGGMTEEFFNAQKAMEEASGATIDYADAAADAAAAYYDYVTTVDDGIETQQIATEGTRAARDAMREYNEQLLFTIASEGMNEDQALSLAIAMGLVDESTMAATTEVEFLRQRFEDGLITAQQYEDAILRLQGAIDGLKGKEVMIKVNVSGTGVSLLSGIADLKVGNLGDTQTGYSKATGGVVHAASGMAMQAPYLVGEVGPEPFFPAVDGRILSNSQAMSALRSGGRSAGNVTVVINTPVNMADSVWVERELAPYIDKAMREALRA